MEWILLNLFIFECRHQQLHKKGISLVRNLLASHDVDSRYQNRDVKARIATLYMPLIGIVIDALPQLCIESRPQLQHQQSTYMSDTRDAHGIDQNVAMAIAGSSVYSVPGESSITVKVLLCTEPSSIYENNLIMSLQSLKFI